MLISIISRVLLQVTFPAAKYCGYSSDFWPLSSRLRLAHSAAVPPVPHAVRMVQAALITAAVAREVAVSPTVARPAAVKAERAPLQGAAATGAPTGCAISAVRLVQAGTSLYIRLGCHACYRLCKHLLWRRHTAVLVCPTHG